MKKIIVVLMAVVLCFSLAACGGSENADGGNGVGSIFNNGPQTVTYGVVDFDALLKTTPVFVQSTEYVVQDESYKTLYPDMLQAVLQNNSAYDVKNAVLAFVAWDANNLPIKIKGSMDFSDGSYVKRVNYNDINLVSGGTFGNSSGFEVDESCGINTFKAIVVSYETFDGNSWENPYFDEWCKLYEGVKFDNTLTVEVVVEDTNTGSTDANTTSSVNTDTITTSATNESSILAQIEAQAVKVVSTKYVVQDESYKTLYPDMLQAVIQNNSAYDIKNAVLAFVAWDVNNLPVKIKGSMDFSDGAYIKRVNYNDINLVPGGTYGNTSGFEIDETCGIKTFKAIVVSYETFNGETWENPMYNDWCALYEGVKL